MIWASFQDFLEPRRQAFVFIWITLLHFSQIRDRPGDPFRFDLLDLVPQLGEALDGRIIGRPTRPFLDQITEHVDDPPELASVTILSNNFPLGLRGAGILLRHVNVVRDEPARKNRLSEYLRSNRRKWDGPRIHLAPQPRPPREPFCGVGYRIHGATIGPPPLVHKPSGPRRPGLRPELARPHDGHASSRVKSPAASQRLPAGDGCRWPATTMRAFTAASSSPPLIQGDVAPR